jgi:hypothetical protein
MSYLTRSSPFCGNRIEARKRTLMYQLEQHMDEIAPSIEKALQRMAYLQYHPRVFTIGPPKFCMRGNDIRVTPIS